MGFVLMYLTLVLDINQNSLHFRRVLLSAEIHLLIEDFEHKLFDLR